MEPPRADPALTRSHDPDTLCFYANEALTYAARSQSIGPSETLKQFVAKLPAGARVLDLGCGTGRDTIALIQAGVDVVAIDGSAEMAAEAQRLTGLAVRTLLFEDLDFSCEFDGIWANASLLHVPREGLAHVLKRVHCALKPHGLLYASFKSGGVEGRDRLGRYYNYLNPNEVRNYLAQAGEWFSLEFTEGRGTGYDGTETGWVAAWARKSTDAV